MTANASQARRERRWGEHDRGAARRDEFSQCGAALFGWVRESGPGQYFQSRMDNNGDGSVDCPKFVLLTKPIASTPARSRQFFKQSAFGRTRTADAKGHLEEFRPPRRGKRSSSLDDDPKRRTASRKAGAGKAARQVGTRGQYPPPAARRSPAADDLLLCRLMRQRPICPR